jgi:hypothetical protein
MRFSCNASRSIRERSSAALQVVLEINCHSLPISRPWFQETFSRTELPNKLIALENGIPLWWSMCRGNASSRLGF